LLCTWFGGTRENHPDVNIWLARKPKGGTWQSPMSICDGDGKALFNPVLVKLKGGDIQIYFVSPGINDGKVITSNDIGYKWSKAKELPEGFVGPIVNKPVYLNDGTIIAGGSLQVLLYFAIFVNGSALTPNSLCLKAHPPTGG